MSTNVTTLALSHLPSIGETIGAAFIGSTLSMVLYGITTLQAFFYYRRFSEDSVFQKSIVAGLWIVDTFHQVILTHALYHYIVVGLTSPLKLFIVVWSIKLHTSITIGIVVVVQTLYFGRLWKLAHLYHRTIFLIVFAGAYVVAFMAVVQTWRLVVTFKDTTHGAMAKIILATFSTSTFIDFAIGASICFYLLKFKSHLQFARTDSKITKAIRYIICSGIATSVCSLVALIAFNTSRDTLIFLASEFVLGKLEINSYLAMLNARERPSTGRDLEVYVESYRIEHIDTTNSVSTSPPGVGGMTKNNGTEEIATASHGVKTLTY